ncbi:MAG: hypothetical protein ACAI38_11545 [Myxococcota bacterium]
MRHLLTAVIILSSAACATTGQFDGAKQYVSPTLTLPQVGADLTAAVEQLVRHEGWTVVARTKDRIEAVSRADESMGVAMRERWVFAITDYEVAVVRTLEAQFDKGGAWEHETQVCTGYVYMREREVLAQVEKHASRGGYAVAASSVKPGS